MPARKAPAVAVGKVFAVSELPARRYAARVVSPAAVDITTRVSGEIIEQNFAEGGRVKKGDVLYRLDPVRYEAALKDAKGDLAEAKAELAYAKTALARAKSLYERQAESRDTYDSAVRTEKTAQAAVLKAEASVTLAEDDLKHCEITSPADGRAGVSVYPVGSWITTSSSALTSVVVTDPIRVRFALSMKDILSLFGSVKALSSDARITVELANGTKLPAENTVGFTSNQAGTDTDTLDVYAVVANPDETLVAGSTVAVHVTRANPGAAVGVLPSAVMHDADGAWVWVVKDSSDGAKTVEKRRIELGTLSDSAAVITSGLAVGETVVTDGTHKPSEGGAIRVVEGE